MMGRRAKLKSGDEYDVVCNRRLYGPPAGVCGKVKRRLRGRERRQGRREAEAIE